MKRFLSLVGSVILISLALAVAVSAQSNVVHMPVFVDNPPIPVGEVVEFQETADGDLAVIWKQKRANGYQVHRYVFEGAKLTIDEYPYKSSIYSWAPVAGDTATVRAYYDWQLHDGVADYIYFSEFREWTAEEVQLLDLKDEFYQEAVEKKFGYLWYVSDFSPDGYLVDGQEAKPGPYGNTILLNPAGSKVEAYDLEEGKKIVRWTQKNVKPGDAITGGEDETHVRSFKDMDPWRFYYILEDMRPQWQSERDISYNLAGIYPRVSEITPAVLNRLGFVPVRQNTPDNFQYKIFGWKGKQHGVELGLPVGKWMPVRQIEVANAVYTATLKYDQDFEREYPELNLVGETNWPYYPTMEFDAPIVFVKWEEMWLDSPFVFDWPRYPIYKVSKDGNQAAIWKYQMK